MVDNKFIYKKRNRRCDHVTLTMEAPYGIYIGDKTMKQLVSLMENCGGIIIESSIEIPGRKPLI